MDSGRLIFDSSPSLPAHMLILGGSGNSIFRGARSMLSMENCANKRPRPFFSSPEEFLEEEYYDEQLPEKKRRLTPEQVHLLERSFETENKLEPERKSELAKKLGLQPRQVAVWFQNRRARWKTKQLERDFDCLKAAYDSLLADHESLLKDNDRLHSQVVALTEKLLQAKEPAIVGPVAESTADESPSLHTNGYAKAAEDHLSAGSGRSGVLDGDGPQLVDSSDESYFHQDSFHGDCIVGAVGGGGVRSAEEDDGSDDGCNYGMFGDSHHATDALWGAWN